MMGLRRVRRRCERLAKSLHLPIPLNPQSLCEQFSDRWGRPIQLLTRPLSVDAPCGLWISTGEADYIVVEQETTDPHRCHIILHEISHLLLEHSSTPQVLTDNALQLLMPHLGDVAIGRLLGRTRYDSREEQEAEMLASVIFEYASGVSPAASEPRIPEEMVSQIHRASATFE